jgi:FkbM family methyltransferase
MSGHPDGSQHGEATTLDELLGHPQNGFYIDVGAHNPNSDTVTQMFYQRGWNGINIEPQRQYHDQLQAFRNRDINLNIAVGAEPGLMELALGDGLSTFVEKFAHTDWEKITVPVLTLKQVCDMYVKDKTIDFLKIDVEGFEREVILGMDWEKYRPKALCIEATIPMSDIPNYQDWEVLVLSAGYKFVKADAVNRYYIEDK